jgi:NAD+ synthase
VAARVSLNLDVASAETEIMNFIARVVEGARAKGVVLGLSGGIDSAVVGALCVKALGKEKVVALLMPSEHTPAEDVEDARNLASNWGVKAHVVPISDVGSAFFAAMPVEGDKVAKGNVHARIRMATCYYFANVMKLLVAGTGDRSELLLGFFSKGGDGVVDFLPIAHLYKTQVRQLGEHLGIPERIVNKPPSPRLWPGHLATDELPADYATLDRVLHCLFDDMLQPEAAAEEAGVSREVVDAALKMNARSEHKRTSPPMVR